MPAMSRAESKPPLAQGAPELVADVALEGLEGRCQQLLASGTELVARRQAGPGREPLQPQQDGFLRRGRVAVVADVHAPIQIDELAETSPGVWMSWTPRFWKAVQLRIATCV